MIKHNYLAIIVMIIAHMVIGFLWYGVVFSETWSHAALGKPVAEVQKQPMSAVPYIINIIGAACACFFISWLVQKLNITTFSGGLQLGVYAAIGLVFPALATHYLFLNISNTVLAIDLGMSITLTILTAGVLAAWRKNKEGGTRRIKVQ